MDSIQEFFKNNPAAPGLLKVGESLYLISQAGAARDHAKRFGLEVEHISNPNAEAGDEKMDAKPAAKSKGRKTK